MKWHRRLLRRLLSLGALCAPLLLTTACSGQEAVSENRTISRFDAPFLFAYGTWQNRVRVEGGRALLRGEGATPKGGAGCATELDLRAAAADSPALRLRVGAANRMRTLRLLLRDADEQGGIWEFTLPEAGGEFTLVTPREGGSLEMPESREKPGRPLDLARIRQWQLIGDWGSDLPMDVEVEAILIVAPDAATLQRRAERARREEEERERVRQEQRSLRERYGMRSENSPRVEAVGMVAPDILSLTIQAGRVVPGRLEPYRPEAGDTRSESKDSAGRVQQVRLVRRGEEIGWLIGPKRETLVTFEKMVGDPLLTFVADAAENYTIRSADDPAYRQGRKPEAVYRKSKPTDWAQPGRAFAMRHILYLRLPRPLQPGRSYTVSVGEVNVKEREVAFVFDPVKRRSEAVRVNQIGYRPDDPVKRAFLSIWLGTGGAYQYPNNLRFRLVEDASGRTVYRGAVTLAKDVSEPEPMFRTENFNKTSVYRMDFSDFSLPGRYRVVVEGIGCSYPFEIGPKVWERAFLIQMRGLYNNRSGIALGPPFSAFRKPRDFHPADGAKVYQSAYSILDGGNEGDGLERGSTGKIVPQAWGGYHDAGDWNPRRITHMKVTLAQIELLEIFSDYFRALSWKLPDTVKAPSILQEALFELDLFRRLQTPEGGVPYGIETNGDPLEGEVSWIQSMPAYVYAPDLWSSYIYAGVAGRAAKLLATTDKRLAALYRESALKAMRWAEADYAKRRAAGTLDRLRWEVKDDRNLAAIALYDLTGDRRWHDLFLENTCLKDPNAKIFVWGSHVQRDAAFFYARLSDRQADPVIKRNAVRAVLSEADAALNYAKGNAFNLTTPDRGKPMFLGFYSTPDAVELARAHYLTGRREYLAGVVQACQFASGCNPNNMTYTVGVGVNGPRNPLKLDSRRTGQPAPLGITVYGNFDFVGWNDFSAWVLDYYLKTACTPTVREWPLPEAYFDIFLAPSTNEFTVDVWSNNVYVWGYLAARAGGRRN